MSLNYYNTEHDTRAGQTLAADLCIYGGTSSGIVAAITAVRRGLRVVLLNNGAHLGGLTTGGLGLTDFGNKTTIGGIAREFYRRLGEHYGTGEEWRFEPSAASAVYQKMLAEAGLGSDRLTLVHRQFLPTGTTAAAAATAVTVTDNRIREIRLESGLTVRAPFFMDCTYEGDLMAAAGVPFTIGREGNDRYGELLNGVQIREHHQFEIPVSPWIREGDPASGLLPGISPRPPLPTGSGDACVQAYNFRMCLTRDPALRAPFPKPADYDPANYELLARYLRGGWRDIFFKYDPIRGGKTDTNNHGAVSTDYIGQNHDYPAATHARREQIFQAHVNYQQGLLWFYCHDPRVPADIRARMNEWGLAADEFTDTGHWPPQLYIREARRMVSDYVFTELDCRGYRHAPDPVGYGSYGMDSHNCQRLVIGGRVLNEGDVQYWLGTKFYPVSYRSTIPPRGDACIKNLLIPVCLSASHIAYGSARMEPVFMILGQSCATAAALCLQEKTADGSGQPLALQDLPYATLRRELLAAGQILTPPPPSPLARGN